VNSLMPLALPRAGVGKSKPLQVDRDHLT
jgi:hypothetical protein